MNRVGLVNRDSNRHFVSGKLCAVSAGHFYGMNEPERAHSVIRPHGMPDYQLIFIRRGSGTYRIGDRDVQVGEGNVVLFYPYEPQFYRYPTDESIDIYWLHFGGTEAEELLKKLGLSGKKLIRTTNDSIADAIRLIIKEALERPRFMDESCTALVLSLLTELARECDRRDDPIERAIAKINADYAGSIGNRELANLCGFSLSHFLYRFKQLTGQSPQQYKTEQRMLMAKELLSDTDYSIKKIAEMVGYGDPLYFTRIFRKQTGGSPSRYREKIIHLKTGIYNRRYS